MSSSSGVTSVEQAPPRSSTPVRPVVLAVDDTSLNLELLVDYLSDVECDVAVEAVSRRWRW